MKQLLFISLLTASACTAIFSCSSNRNTTVATTGRQIPPGIYFDAHRPMSASTKSDWTTDELFKHMHTMLWGSDSNPKTEWHRPTTLPQIDIVDSRGNHWTNKDLLGRITVFNFWYSICPPCMSEIPWLLSLQDSFPQCNFIGVNVESPSTIKKIMKSRNFKWAHIAADSTLTTWLPRETYYPTTIVVDQNGFVRTFNAGASATQQKRVTDTIKSIIERGPLSAPLYYKDLHYEEEYTTF